MPNKTAYESSLSAEIAGFIDEKQALGFKYAGEARIMRNFDRYWKSHGYPREGLSADNLSEWCRMSDTEGAGSLMTRISVVRQFSVYLNGIGLKSYVPPMKVRYDTPLPHIFTKDELDELFSVIDSYKATTYAYSSKRIANEYPVLFRLIYLNGLRISEACKLAASDVDLDNGVITILDGKQNKDRLIYLSEDMRQLCMDYHRYMCRVTDPASKWFFPGRKTADHISIATVDSKFNEFWNRTTFSQSCCIKPTVHSLRHTFVVERINRWMEQGLDFNCMLPYLCRFLGHKTFDETYYYYHYTEEAAKTIHQTDTTAEKVIPEVMRR